MCERSVCTTKRTASNQMSEPNSNYLSVAFSLLNVFCFLFALCCVALKWCYFSENKSDFRAFVEWMCRRHRHRCWSRRIFPFYDYINKQNVIKKTNRCQSIMVRWAYEQRTAAKLSQAHPRAFRLFFLLTHGLACHKCHRQCLNRTLITIIRISFAGMATF